MVMNENRHTTTPHCWTIPNVEVTEAKQQMYLSPCSIDRVDQRFDAVDGMARVRSNLNVCIMWNLATKTRLWALPCGEQYLSEPVSRYTVLYGAN